MHRCNKCGNLKQTVWHQGGGYYKCSQCIDEYHTKQEEMELMREKNKLLKEQNEILKGNIK